MKQIPDFKSIEERDQWITDNADYFTTLVYWGEGGRSFSRYELSTLLNAEKAANFFAKNGYKSMIYAVVGASDAFVKSVFPEGKSDKQNSTTDNASST